MSSGGICAWTVAWQRPTTGRVLSHIGSFVNIRAGHVYPAIIRKNRAQAHPSLPPDGSNDLNNLHGNRPLANQEMASALAFAGYDFRFEFGDGAHNGKHGGAILPVSLRWLWRPDTALYPHRSRADNLAGDEALSRSCRRKAVGNWWAKAMFTDAACGDGAGNFYFADLPAGTPLPPGRPRCRPGGVAGERSEDQRHEDRSGWQAVCLCRARAPTTSSALW
jgi:hypothetical protein